jgi:nitrite reductase/ring-hydroxylating ferredoxin subunit
MKNGIKVIIPVIGALMLLGLVLLATACGSASAQQKIKATWIKPGISGETVSVPVSEIEKDQIVHFKVPVSNGGQLAFMAYEIGGTLNVRSNVCPPCRSIGFSLVGDTLVCDTCGTVFKAGTGMGVSGPCVNYPKATVAYELQNGEAVMNTGNLVTAYQSTIEPGLP